MPEKSGWDQGGDKSFRSTERTTKITMIYEGRERQAIVTELRDLGDNRTLVLHTSDNRVYRKIRNLVEPIKIVPYEQERGAKVAIVGVDLYFPKEYRKWLEKNIAVATKQVK